MQSVLRFSGPHEPPPSTTGTMWSMSQNRRFRCFGIPCNANHATRRSAGNILNSLSHLMQSRAQRQQIPRSRFLRKRSIPEPVRIIHRSTQAFEQNVQRLGGTSVPHCRHSARPFGPFGRSRTLTLPPFWCRGSIPAKQNYKCLPKAVRLRQALAGPLHPKARTPAGEHTRTEKTKGQGIVSPASRRHRPIALPSTAAIRVVRQPTSGVN